MIKAAKELGAHVQIGGGIRTKQDIAHYLENGVERVILGSRPFQTRNSLKK